MLITDVDINNRTVNAYIGKALPMYLWLTYEDVSISINTRDCIITPRAYAGGGYSVMREIHDNLVE